MSALSRIGLFLSAGVLACLVSCSPRDEGDLGSIPSTFTGTLEVQPQGRLTKDLYLSIVSLAKRYGMAPRGALASNGQDWQIQIYCGNQYVGGGTTTREGALMLFGLAIYGFKDAQDYERFKVEMLELMKPYGVLSSLKDVPRLSQEELLKRGKYMGLDVTSKCGPGATAG